MVQKIVAIAGRKLSGKSEISKYLIEKLNYQKISFADHLKNLCIDLYDLNPLAVKDQVLKEKKFDKPLEWNIYKCKELSWLIGNENINNTFVANSFSGDKLFHSTRDVLQYIGTEVLKKQDSLFHVKKTMENIDPDINYVCDDLRFPEEKFYLEKNKTHNFFSFYLIKPDNWQVSNHISESSLNWSMFKNQIVNDKAIHNLLSSFEDNMNMLINNESIKEKGINNAFLFLGPDEKKYSSFIFKECSYEIIKDESTIKMYVYHSDHNKLKNLTDYINSQKIFEHSLSTTVSGGVMVISCPFVIENLKYWKPNT